MTHLRQDYPQIAAERESAERRRAVGDALFLCVLIVVSLAVAGVVVGIVGGIAWHVGTAVLRALS